MKFVGLDLGGVNSLACVRDDAGAELFRGSLDPERPSCVLLPLVRKEKLLAGNEALRNERGSGMHWPPLAMAAPDGWSRATPPSYGGRILLATIWQSLNAGGQWSDPQWQPPDGLPVLNKPTPAECLAAEVRTVMKQMPGDTTATQVVLAIPNQLPEESQESLLRRLPAGCRLVWRSVAGAMSWADANASQINAATQLAVLDVGLHGIEVSVFEFRQEDADGRTFQVPVRRLNRLRLAKTGTLLADTPAPFSVLRPELTRLEQHLGEISQAVGEQAHLLICGPLAEALLALLLQRFPHLSWPSPDANAVARGSSLFVWRLAHGWPTYLDLLPSLELFTLTEEHEPNWLALIPADCEVSGGRDFEQVFARRIFIEKDTTRLASWLQRSGEIEFRKLTTDLPVQAARNAWVDIRVTARSASGFAHVRITPSQGEFGIFGEGRSLLLNWQSMERIARGPKEKWPVKLKYGWPTCGKLYAHRRFFDEFLMTATDIEAVFTLRDVRQRLGRLGILKERIRQTIAPHLAGIRSAGGDAAPVNLLVSFSTDAPCQFLETGYSEQSRETSPLPGKEREANTVAKVLWRRLKELNGNLRAAISEINAVTYLLGRMGGHAPDAFRTYVARNLYPTSKTTLLFAAGRVLNTSEHGRLLFTTLKDKTDLCQPLNLNWLRMLVYVLYQRTDILREVPRDHIAATANSCLDTLEQHVEQNNARVLFMNSLRALALLLRTRRHAQSRDFMCASTQAQGEISLARRLKRTLEKAQQLRLSSAARTLVERTLEWLDFAASTDEMPPIAPPGEEEVDNEND